MNFFLFQYHPDTAKENNTHEKFIEVNEAFQTLSKPISRRDYDLKLKYGTEQFEYKTQEEAKEKQPSWREKPYWCVIKTFLIAIVELIYYITQFLFLYELIYHYFM